MAGVSEREVTGEIIPVAGGGLGVHRLLHGSRCIGTVKFGHVLISDAAYRHEILPIGGQKDLLRVWKTAEPIDETMASLYDTRAS